MNLEHVEAAKNRIEEIRRRFVSLERQYPISTPASTGGISFSDALSRAKSGKRVHCPEELEPIIKSAADKNGLDPAVIKAVMRVESNFRSDAVSRVGAQGLMQLMPGTARSLGIDPLDPEQNIEGGARYLKQQIDKFGSIEKALAAYNAGPGTVMRYGGVPPYAETQRYVENVMRYIDQYSENG